MARSITLATEASNGTGDTVAWDGGEGTLYASGTWGGATVTLQYAPVDPTSTVALTPADTDIVLSGAEPLVSFYPLPVGKIRVVIAGGGGTESLTVVAGRYK